MAQYQINGSMIVNSGQVASSNNGFDPQLRSWTYQAVGMRDRTYRGVGMRPRTYRAVGQMEAMMARLEQMRWRH